jgi:hypothetical protein
MKRGREYCATGPMTCSRMSIFLLSDGVACHHTEGGYCFRQSTHNLFLFTLTADIEYFGDI